jgi:hypothetical protein
MSTFIGGSNSTQYGLFPSQWASRGSPARASATRTTGSSFWVAEARKLAGVRIYHVASGSESATITLFSDAGATLAQATRTVSTTGELLLYFDADYDLVAATKYWLGLYIPGVYVSFSDPATATLPGPNNNRTNGYVAQPGVDVGEFNYHHTSANTKPNTTSAARYGVAPLILR